MKKFLLCIAVLLIQLELMAQLPQAMNYQAVARNATGSILTFANISLRFSILDGGPSGNPQYVETQTTQTNQFGLFTVNIGQGTVVSGNFISITWFAGNKFLKVEMDANGGTNYSLAASTPLLSVPFAFVAERLSTPPVLSLDDLLDVYTPGPLVTGQVLKFNGVTWSAETDSNINYLPGTGIIFSGDTIFNIGDTEASDDILIGSTAGGDLRGAFPDPEVTGILGRKILDSIPGDGDVLKWDSLAGLWKPAQVGTEGIAFSLPYQDSVNNSTDAFVIINTGSGNAATFSSVSGNALVTGNGNVGIGTNSPVSKLDVNGNINANGNITRTATGASNLLPIAYGTIDGAGNIFPDASTSNISVVKGGLGLYNITIAGELFDFTKYSVAISLADGYAGLTAYTSFNNTLEITTFDISGLATDRIFSFQVFKK